MSANTQIKILLVDDEPEIRDILGIHMSTLGYDFIEAENGEQALEVVKNEKVDVIISDIMMPRMSGMTFLKAMREEGLNYPLIFVTAYPSKDTTVQALRLGAFDFIEKPFDATEIKQVIQEAVRVSQHQTQLGIHDEETKENDQSSVNKEILKMRALRYTEGEVPASASGEDAAGSTSQALDSFVTEATPQLVFCEASVKALGDPKVRIWELGYLFRVMQTISSSAEMLNLKRIAQLASDCEKCFTYFRIRPGQLTEKEHVILSSGVEAMRTLVSHVGTDFETETSVTDAENDIAELSNKVNAGSSAA